MFFFLGVVCTLGLFSCTKSMLHSDRENDDLIEGESETTSANCECTPVPGSTFFDPNCLVSASQHGILDTIQKGFGFTEGPAVDKNGNIFFTDQPNDKIYKWKASNGQITTFLTGTGRSNGMAFDKNGYLIAPEDFVGLAEKLISLLDDPNLCKTMGENGYELARTFYNWGKVTEKMAETIKSKY